MHTDKNTESASGDEALDFFEPDAGESSEESTLRWLLDMDMSEPEEKLFTVDIDELDAGELTGYDLDVASRPMIRGSAGADDLENYIHEEIVISSDNIAGDIYSGSLVNDSEEHQSEAPVAEENMAIDFSRPGDARSATASASVAEGLDILGLQENDDIGEKYLVVRRNKPADADTNKKLTDHIHGNAAASSDEGRGPGQQTAESRLDEVRQLRLVSAAEPVDAAREAYVESGDAAMTDDATVRGIGDAGASAPLQPQPDHVEDVFGYIASVPTPADDEAFDDFLVQGEGLSTGEANFDGLCLESEAQDAELNLWPDSGIDYHRDFTELEGFEGHPAASVAACIPQFMQDLAALIEERLQQLGMEIGCVNAQLEVATDAVHAQQLAQDGYESALEICGSRPAVFGPMDQPQVDTLYLRLLHQESGSCWNRLLDEGFVVPTGDDAPDVAVSSAVEQSDLAPALEAFDILGDQAPVAPETEGSPDDIWQPGEQELDDIFGDLDAAVQLADDENAEQESLIGMTEEEVGSTEELLQVFSEDIFSEDISLELGSETAEEHTDIDAVFDKLHQVVGDGDDICGLEVEEFSGAEEAIAETETELDSQPELVPAATAASEKDSPWYLPAGVVFAQSSPSSGEIFPDFLDAFIEEGSSELEKLEDAVAAWERDCASEPAYTAVTRILHTVKGIAKGVGLHCYGTLIHNFETLLGAVTRPEAGGEAEYFRLVNAWLDAAVRGLDHIRDNRSDIANTLPQPASSPQAGSTDARQNSASPHTEIGRAHV